MRRYWDFDSSKRIRHNTDAEYEEHFRAAFGEAVRRRLRSDSPILAELSGGMDSSSIVCMADNIIAGDGSETSRLDTISYFNEFEPNWNERPYFEKVEARRGRAGCHIDVGTRENTAFELDDTRFLVSPGSGEANPTEASKRFADYLRMMGNRVLLSGIGGDEVTCGVPSPSPQLADLLARGHFRTLAHQLKVWALNKRKPWFYLLFDAARGFFPPPLFMPKYKRPVPWLNRDFVKRNRSALRGYEARLKLFFGGLPSFQDNMNTLDGLRRQLAYACPRPGSLYEKRFPYLDRDLLEFLYTIPQEQLLRPGQRRSLMRRSLVGIVPNEILERKRKAFVSRALVSSINEEWQTWSEVSQHMLTTSAGITDAEAFHRLLERAKKGEDVQTARLLATFGIERWLRHVNRWTRANKGPETTQTKQTADQPYELSVALR